MIRTLNIVSGLTLFLFITTHLLNLTLGIISIDVMEASRPYFFAVWTNFPSEIILVLALLVHPILALRALYMRNTLRMSNQDKLQLVSSLLIIPLLIPHVVAIKAGQNMLGMEATFTGFLTIMWVDLPLEGLRQVLLLIVAWVHGCIGLFTWIKIKPWWKPIAPYAYPLAVAIPTFALLGFVEAGRDAVERHSAAQIISSQVQSPASSYYPTAPIQQSTVALETPNDIYGAAKQQSPEAKSTPSEAAFQKLSNEISRLNRLLISAYLALIGLVFFARYLRLRRHREWVELHYADGEVIRSVVGPTLLEIAIMNDLPHANLCHGKGRCGTCRVRIDQSSSLLTPISNLERAMLDKLKSDKNTRLACQVAPSGGVIHLKRLLSADLSLKNTKNALPDSAEVLDSSADLTQKDLLSTSKSGASI